MGISPIIFDYVIYVIAKSALALCDEAISRYEEIAHRTPTRFGDYSGVQHKCGWEENPSRNDIYLKLREYSTYVQCVKVPE